MTVHTFTRRNGTRFQLTLTVDHDKLAASLARKMTSRGKATATRCDGAVTATLTEIGTRE